MAPHTCSSSQWPTLCITISVFCSLPHWLTMTALTEYNVGKSIAIAMSNELRRKERLPTTYDQRLSVIRLCLPHWQANWNVYQQLDSKYRQQAERDLDDKKKSLQRDIERLEREATNACCGTVSQMLLPLLLNPAPFSKEEEEEEEAQHQRLVAAIHDYSDDSLHGDSDDEMTSYSALYIPDVDFMLSIVQHNLPSISEYDTRFAQESANIEKEVRRLNDDYLCNRTQLEKATEDVDKIKCAIISEKRLFANKDELRDRVDELIDAVATSESRKLNFPLLHDPDPEAQQDLTCQIADAVIAECLKGGRLPTNQRIAAQSRLALLVDDLTEAVAQRQYCYRRDKDIDNFLSRIYPGFLRISDDPSAPLLHLKPKIAHLASSLAKELDILRRQRDLEKQANEDKLEWTRNYDLQAEHFERRRRSYEAAQQRFDLEKGQQTVFHILRTRLNQFLNMLFA